MEPRIPVSFLIEISRRDLGENAGHETSVIGKTVIVPGDGINGVEEARHEVAESSSKLSGLGLVSSDVTLAGRISACGRGHLILVKRS
jgi:hypothetical protein